jgi:hypothetical protein
VNEEKIKRAVILQDLIKQYQTKINALSMVVKEGSNLRFKCDYYHPNYANRIDILIDQELTKLLSKIVIDRELEKFKYLLNQAKFELERL